MKIDQKLIIYFRFLRVLQKLSNDARLDVKLLIIVTATCKIQRSPMVIDARSGIFPLLKTTINPKATSYREEKGWTDKILQ